MYILEVCVIRIVNWGLGISFCLFDFLFIVLFSCAWFLVIEGCIIIGSMGIWV